MKKYVIFFFLLLSISMNADNELPIIKMTGDFGYDYQEGKFTIIYPDGSIQENLSAIIKWRGGTTNTDGKHKRNYKIKFTEDYSFFDLRNDNNWILDAGQADVFRLRNRIATELWNDFATKPYYINEEPKALSGVRGEVVEVYLNDEYIGIYSFIECMDRKQMKLKKFEKNGTIHGVLWKSTGFSSSMMNIVPEYYDNSKPMMDVFEAKYPELDDLPETDYSTLWNAINFVVNSDDENFKAHVHEYFDIPVVLDYYLFINLLAGLDNTGKNMYWATYDQQTDKKITPAIWDLDMTVGASSLKHIKEDFISPQIPILDCLNLITRLKSLNVDYFNEKVNQRYSQLRKSFFSPKHLSDRYLSYYNKLKLSGAAKREQIRWSCDTDINGEVIDFDEEIQYINYWINQRIQYLDNIFDYNESTKIIELKTTYDENAVFYNMHGQRINNSYSFKKGIYIRNGKKYIK